MLLSFVLLINVPRFEVRRLIKRRRLKTNEHTAVFRRDCFSAGPDRCMHTNSYVVDNDPQLCGFIAVPYDVVRCDVGL